MRSEKLPSNIINMLKNGDFKMYYGGKKMRLKIENLGSSQITNFGQVI